MDALDRRLLDEFQRDFPLIPRPFVALADTLGIRPAEILGRLGRLVGAGAVARIGATFRPHRVGASTLAAMAVPPERLEAVAALVGGFEEVNHNYQREHRLNLWFVVTAANWTRVHEVLAEIRVASGLDILDLPLERSYRLDLGFPLWT